MAIMYVGEFKVVKRHLWNRISGGDGTMAMVMRMAMAMGTVVVVASPTKKAAPGNTVPVSSPWSQVRYRPPLRPRHRSAGVVVTGDW